MEYREFEPGPALRGRARFWRLTAESAPGDAPQPVLPDGCVELIVHLGDPFALESGGRRELQPRVLLAGPGTRPVRLAPTGRIDVIGAHFEAGVARALARGSMAELVDRIPELDAVAPALARGLATELAEAGAAWRVRLEQRLERALAPERSGPAAALAHAVAGVRASGGRRPIAALAHELGLSTRTLERRFEECVGLGPKTFARLVRFQRALAWLRRPTTSIAAVAARCGYFDQAHLVRDFRRFAGTSPSRLRAEGHELTEQFVSGAP